MSRFLDERGRILGKVNVVDILVLLVIVAVVVFAVVRVTGGGSSTVPVRVVFTAEAVRSSDAAEMQQNWQPGVTITGESGIVLGKVQKLEVKKTPEEFFNSKDQLQRVDSLIFSDVVVEVLGQGQYSNGVVRIGGVSVTFNDKVILVGHGAKRQTVVTRVRWGQEALK